MTVKRGTRAQAIAYTSLARAWKCLRAPAVLPTLKPGTFCRNSRESCAARTSSMNARP